MSDVALILTAAAAGARYLALIKGNPHHDSRSGRFTSGRHGTSVARSHEKPRKVRGSEHADWIEHQRGQRREHASDLRGERRELRHEHQRERRTIKREQERESGKLDRGQQRERDTLTRRQDRESARSQNSEAMVERHRSERSELADTHRQERDDLTSQHAADRRTMTEDHREARKDQRAEHLERVADFRRDQRSDMTEALRSIRETQRDAREAQGKSLVLKDQNHPEEPENTYGLPEGEDIEAELRRIFGEQAEEVLGAVPEIGEPLPRHLPNMAAHDAAMAEAFTPLLSAYWDRFGHQIRAKIGLEPDAWPSSWNVHDPHLRQKIQDAALAFCQSTNATTSKSLDDALLTLKMELTEGIVTEGESIAQLTKRVQSVFEHAEKYRARRIAATETSRAVHAAQYQSVAGSDAAQGIEWLVSANSCPLCKKIASEVKSVPLGRNFAVIGNNPTYQNIKYPPAHPTCRCSYTIILDPEFGGPDDVEWGETLIQPKIEDEYDPPPGVTEARPRPNARQPRARVSV